MGDYQNAPVKLHNRGLDVSVPPDLLEGGKYTRLTNVRTLQEGQMSSRFGLQKGDFFFECGWITYMRRLNDSHMLYVLSEGDVFINDQPLNIYNDALGVGLRVGTEDDPNPETGNLGRYPLRLEDPYTVKLVKYTNSFSGEDWGYFATDEGMWKIDPDGVAYKWGIRPPKVPNGTYVEAEAEVVYEYEPKELVPAIVACPPDDEGDYGCGLDDVSPNTSPYRWVYTYYASRTGAESNPNDEMSVEVTNIRPTEYDGATLTQRGQAVKLTGFIKPTDPQVDRLRIYRFGGSLNEYLLEQEVPWDTEEFIAFRGDVEIAVNPILSFDNDVPFATIVPAQQADELPGGYQTEDDEFGITEPVTLFETPMGRAWGPFSGSYIFATGDSYRPGVVYWTNLGNPDGSSTTNWVQVSPTSEPCLNGFVFGGNGYVWTRDNLYALDWGGPTAVPVFTPRQVPMGLGLSGQKAFAVGTQGVYFLSKDGIYSTDCVSYSTQITKDSLRPIFLGQEASLGDVDTEDPEFYPLDWGRSDDIIMTVAGQELHLLYWDEQGTRMHLFYDILHERWQRFIPANERVVTYVYGDENKDRWTIWMSLNDGGAYTITEEFEEGDQVSLEEENYFEQIPFDVYFRTGSGDGGQPLTHKEWGVLMVDADCFGKTIEITPFYDAESEPGEVLLMGEGESGRQVYTYSLGDLYSKNIALDFAWQGKATIYQVTVQYRIDEEEVVHWEHFDTSLKTSGWKHIRDLYLGVRCTTPLQLIVEIDGVPYKYFVNSTQGERRKAHVYLEPVKGKVFRLFLDANYEETGQTDPAAGGTEVELVPVKGNPFRIYADDTYMFMKPWHTGNTYTKVNIGGSGGAF